MKRIVILMAIYMILTGCSSPCFTPKYASQNKGQEGAYFTQEIVTYPNSVKTG